MTDEDDGRPNFFILLELDPAAPWDEALFIRQSALWSKEASGLGSRASAAKKKLHLKEEILRVMRDPDRRDRERSRARKLREAARIVRRQQFSARLDLLLTRGFLLAAEVSRLRADFTEVLASSPELDRRLAEAPVRSTLADVPERLHPAREKEIRTHLDGVGARSLYDVLHDIDGGVNPESPRERLLAAAAELATKAGGIKDKRDPKVVHWERLSSLAQVVFDTADERRRHDESMRHATLRDLLAELDGILSVAAEVSAAQMERLLNLALERGIKDPEYARAHFVAHFRARKWPVQLPGEESVRRLARLVRCAYCQELNEPHEQICRTCGEGLHIPCPNCGKVEPRHGGGCRCGFPIGQRPLVESLIADARAATDRLDFARARLDQERAERIWRLPPDRADELTVRIRASRRSLEEAQDRITTAATTVERLVRERRFVTALDHLRTAPDGVPGRASLLAQAEDAVQRARELCRRARQPDLTAATRVEMYTEALRVCDDYESARTALRALPPEPPRRMRAVVDGPAAGVRLEWQPSPDPDVSYVVVRGTGRRAPRYPEDLPDEQQRIGTTTGNSWRDRGAAQVSGRTLWYAVFTERSGTYSSPAAAAPVLVAGDALDVRGAAEAERVVLTWRMPEHAARVEVRRTELGTGADDVVLSGPEPSRAVDVGVRNGVRYRYTVRVAYRDSTGDLWWSSGVHRDVTPTAPPVPPDPLTATARPATTGLYRHRVHLRWPATAGAALVVRQTGAGWLREGEVVAEETLGRGGLVLAGEPPIDDVWIDADLDVCSYFPVLVLDGSGYVGRARRYAYADEPVDVEGEFVGATVRVGWRWPDGAVAALVGADPAGLPADPTAAPRQTVVDRVGGEAYGGAELRTGDGTELSVLVATVVRRHGMDFVTSGVPVRVRRPAVRVEYEVRHLRRRRELVLWTASPVALPALTLVERLGRAPFTRGDGTHVVETSPAVPMAGRRTVVLPRGGGEGQCYRLFTAAREDSVGVELDQRPSAGA